MSVIAIPLIALGGLFIISNQENKSKKKCEGFEGNSLTNVIPPVPVINYPKTADVSNENVKKYIGNQTTDKFNISTISSDIANSNPSGSVGSGNKYMKSLTGEIIHENEIKNHNNNVPFFGSKIRGASMKNNISENILDVKQGNGSQLQRKVEQAPLFKPSENYQHPHGAPNASDFYQSRVNPSNRMTNVKPWDEERVGPALNKGFGKDGNNGFNSGMGARDEWKPKTVSELRTKTNPKISFSLSGHEGPANNSIKDYANVTHIGNVEKQLPDTYYTLGPSRWFTTTGAEKGTTSRGEKILHDVNRTTTTTSYFGAAGETEASYVKSEYEPCNRKPLLAGQIINPNSQGKFNGGGEDYALKSYSNLPNNRSTTNSDTTFGSAQGAIKAIAAPLLDIIRPTKKDNVVGSQRQCGNPGAKVSGGHIFDPADRTKTTIREMTSGKLDNNHLNINNNNNVGGSRGYQVNEQIPVSVQRDTTGCSYQGVAGPATNVKNVNYDAAYNQRNNVNKTMESRPNQGGTQIFNPHMNVSVGKQENDIVNHRTVQTNKIYSAIPSKETYGNLNTPEYTSSDVNVNRMEPSILDAFKKNPYAQSLQSYA